ncbi:MAG: hemolysin family protein [Planctomycetota bacterium]|nr:hemolysin family protein [Planctomycetota bacterium]MDA1105564.1 hemolysin family protein [Planctomycetota bacterium]
MWAILAGIVAMTAFGELVHLELVQTTQSAIEREADRRGCQARAAWIVQRWRLIEETGAIVRIVGRVSLVLLISWHWSELGPVTVGAIAAAVIWIGTSVVPSALARHAGEHLLLRSVPLLRLLAFLVGPVAWIGERIEDVVGRMVAPPVSVEEEGREEVLDALGDAEREGGIDPVSADMIENVVEFASTTVSEVMTPRTEVEALEYTDDLRSIGAFVGQVGHTRIPVYEGSIDRVIGVLHIRDLVPMLGKNSESFRLADVLRPPVLVPQTKRVRDLLLEFQRTKSHLAVVVDEFGGMAGLATIEDVLEEIVGEIDDEHDTDQAAPLIRHVAPGTWLISGRARVDEVNAAIGIGLTEAADHDTIAGHVLAALGRIPSEGECLKHSGFTLTVTRAAPNRIDELQARRDGA